jgi:hypothetical protein
MFLIKLAALKLTSELLDKKLKTKRSLEKVCMDNST